MSQLLTINLQKAEFRCCEFIKKSAETGLSITNTRPITLSDSDPSRSMPMQRYLVIPFSLIIDMSAENKVEKYPVQDFITIGKFSIIPVMIVFSADRHCTQIKFIHTTFIFIIIQKHYKHQEHFRIFLRHTRECREQQINSNTQWHLLVEYQ